MSLEDIAMHLIANSGEARSEAFIALQEAKKGNFEEAHIHMQRSESLSLLAHKAQTELLVNEANGVKNDLSILLIHAQDHLMASLLAKELISEIIELHQIKADKVNK